MNTGGECGRRNIVVIGASAGGVEALRAILARLPCDSSASFFVVLHMPSHSPSQLDSVLQAVTRMRVHVASDSQHILPDTVYVAPPDRHLILEHDRMRLTRGPRECRARPAIDVLFRSAALAFGPRVIGVVLSGSLDDGTAGLWQIKDRQGLAFVQDPGEAMYRAMPDSAIRHVQVDCIATIEVLADTIASELAACVALPAPPAARPTQQVEALIAMEGNGLRAGVMDLGKMSQYTCPECHGVLVQIEEGKLVRFRCHTGHAYSFRSLLAEVNHAVEARLWDTVRAAEERILILQQLAAIAEAGGHSDEATSLRSKADLAEEKCRPLRALVLDADFFAGE